MANVATTPEPAARIVIADAGPLIHLDELQCLGLLQDFAEVRVPEAVWTEVERHRITQPLTQVMRCYARAYDYLFFVLRPKSMLVAKGCLLM